MRPTKFINLSCEHHGTRLESPTRVTLLLGRHNWCRTAIAVDFPSPRAQEYREGVESAELSDVISAINIIELESKRQKLHGVTTLM